MKHLLVVLAFVTNLSLFSQQIPPAEMAFKKGVVKYNSKDYKGAIVDFSKAAQLNPKHVGALFQRAKCKQMMDDYKGAVEDYTKVIKVKASYAEAYTARGICKYLSLNLAGTPADYKSVIDDFTVAIEFNSRDSVAYLHRGDTKEFLKDYAGALQDYTKLSQICPTNGEAFYYKANCEDKLGKKEDACADWNRALDLKDTRAQAYIAKHCTE
ncbi:MAG: tetratricopeptide repeat protein [Bacteroidia bacterium]